MSAAFESSVAGTVPVVDRGADPAGVTVPTVLGFGVEALLAF